MPHAHPSRILRVGYDVGRHFSFFPGWGVQHAIARLNGVTMPRTFIVVSRHLHFIEKTLILSCSSSALP